MSSAAEGLVTRWIDALDVGGSTVARHLKLIRRAWSETSIP